MGPLSVMALLMAADVLKFNARKSPQAADYRAEITAAGQCLRPQALLRELFGRALRYIPLIATSRVSAPRSAHAVANR